MRLSGRPGSRRCPAALPEADFACYHCFAEPLHVQHEFDRAKLTVNPVVRPYTPPPRTPGISCTLVRCVYHTKARTIGGGQCWSEKHRNDGLSAAVSVGGRVQGLAAAVSGQHARLLEGGRRAWLQRQVDAAVQRLRSAGTVIRVRFCGRENRICIANT